MYIEVTDFRENSPTIAIKDLTLQEVNLIKSGLERVEERILNNPTTDNVTLLAPVNALIAKFQKIQ